MFRKFEKITIQWIALFNLLYNRPSGLYNESSSQSINSLLEANLKFFCINFTVSCVPILYVLVKQLFMTSFSLTISFVRLYESTILLWQVFSVKDELTRALVEKVACQLNIIEKIGKVARTQTSRRNKQLLFVTEKHVIKNLLICKRLKIILYLLL